MHTVHAAHYLLSLHYGRWQSGPTFDYAYPPAKPEVEGRWTEAVWTADATAGAGPMQGEIDRGVRGLT